jgi:hypothetical protein
MKGKKTALKKRVGVIGFCFTWVFLGFEQAKLRENREEEKCRSS